MPEVIFTGPAGRIEGRYHPARIKHAPILVDDGDDVVAVARKVLQRGCRNERHSEVLDDFQRATMPPVVPALQTILIPHCSQTRR